LTISRSLSMRRKHRAVACLQGRSACRLAATERVSGKKCPAAARGGCWAVVTQREKSGAAIFLRTRPLRRARPLRGACSLRTVGARSLRTLALGSLTMRTIALRALRAGRRCFVGNLLGDLLHLVDCLTRNRLCLVDERVARLAHPFVLLARLRNREPDRGTDRERDRAHCERIFP